MCEIVEVVDAGTDPKLIAAGGKEEEATSCELITQRSLELHKRKLYIRIHVLYREMYAKVQVVLFTAEDLVFEICKFVGVKHV